MDALHRRWLRDDPSTPLGGLGVAAERETILHDYTAWLAVLRFDVCAYCAAPGGTVDHVEPQSRPNVTTHTWVNVVGACVSCNGSKADRPLLHWMLARRR